MSALIALLVFLVVALAAFAIGSLIDQRSARARLIRERLATVQKAPERDPEEELASCATNNSARFRRSTLCSAAPPASPPCRMLCCKLA